MPSTSCVTIIRVFFSLLSVVIFIAPAHGENIGNMDGVKLQSTRVLYPGENKNGITFTVTNNTTQPYLLQSRVRSWQPESVEKSPQVDTHDIPFIVLPPLQRFEPAEALTLRIRLTRNTLPKDRESLFVLSLKTIPGQNETKGSAQLALAMQNNLKLFYRPEGLPEYGPAQLAETLRFQRLEGQLKVVNPTPYYLTFRSLSVGKNSVEANALSQMVPPFGQRVYPLLSDARGQVTWRLIDNTGRNTPEQQSSLAD